MSQKQHRLVEGDATPQQQVNRETSHPSVQDYHQNTFRFRSYFTVAHSTQKDTPSVLLTFRRRFIKIFQNRNGTNSLLHAHLTEHLRHYSQFEHVIATYTCRFVIT